MHELAGGQRRFELPVRGYARQGLDHERPLRCGLVRDRQRTRTPAPAAPVDDVEIQHPRAPATAAASAELPLELLERAEHLRRIEPAFDERHGVREIAAGSALRLVQKDGGCIEQAEIFVEPCDCRFDHLWRAAEAPVWPVGADGDGVKVRCA